MQVVLLKKEKLINTILPEKISGNHWITDFENGKKNNLLSVEADGDKWKLISNNNIYIIDSKEVMVPSIELQEYSFYLIKNAIKNEKFYIYCAPLNDKSYFEYMIRDQKEVIIGSDKSSNICYKMGGVLPKTCNIVKENNHYYLNILDKMSTVYLNKVRVLGKVRIDYGDVIFIFGLKLFLLRRDGMDYLLVNNPRNLIEYNTSYNKVVLSKSEFIDDNSELVIDGNFEEKEFFYRTPYFYKKLSTYEVTVDSPPESRIKEESSAVLTIGPMITMSMTSVVSLISTIGSINNGTASKSSSMTSIVMCITMLASSLLWPVITNLYQKLNDKKHEKKRQKAYKAYLLKKEKEIVSALEDQKTSLNNNNLSIKDCQEVIVNKDVRLWQRRITDEDFLEVPIGLGNMPMKINVHFPEEHFTLEDDHLIELARDLGKKERILTDVPILYSFYENAATGVIGNYIIDKEFMDRVILEMITSYSYDELKFVTLTSTDKEDGWDFLKVLPHSWSNDKQTRYFGSNNDDYREIIYEIEKIFNERINNSNESQVKQVPHYFIIIDAIKSVDNYDILKKLMISGSKLGFSLVIMVDNITALPNECKSFINVSRDECLVFKNELNSPNLKFKIDYTPIETLFDLSSILANVPISIKSESETALPNSFNFLEMFQVGKVEQLNSLERWKKSNPVLSLQAPIGIGKNGEIINLDLHEKYHGPHGLIAGTTGSGKSEFIITYILSLAVNYHPNEVQFILIDYKGGGLTGAFTNDSYRLPHLAGAITNLDGSELNRSLASIESEVKRRQAAFNEARKITGESNVDIYKYQKLWREGRLEGQEPIAHLFIISDEFAELKEQQPEFMDKLISVARVGRSLGVHLILATQKPGGVVDSQIWSNTRFRVCLKVQDTSDSQEVLKKPDAAYLKKTGRFYLQVGYDEIYVLGQAAWAGAQYYPSNGYKKDIDTSLNLINNIGFVTKSKDSHVDVKKESLGEQLPNVVKYLSESAKNDNIQVHKLWLEKIPAKIYVDNLKEKYSFIKENFILNPIVGEYDDPVNQNQYALTIPFTNEGNVAIYGIAGSGKENLLSSIIYSSITSYTPEEVNFYIMDFASETLKIFKDSPYVGDFITLNESEKLRNFIRMLNDELDRRKELFSSYGGSYTSYIKESNEQLPNIVVILNGFENFSESYDDLTDDFDTMARDSFKYGIYFVYTMTGYNSLRSKSKQNFNLVYALKQNVDYDYQSILGSNKKIIPTDYVGRGLFKDGDTYEFQTASITPDNLNTFIKNVCQKQNESTKYRAKKVPLLPSIVDFNVIKDSIKLDSNAIIGVSKNSLNAVSYNFKKKTISIIASQDIDNQFDFINNLATQIVYQKYYNLMIFNGTENSFSNNKLLNNAVFDKGYDTILEKLFKYTDEVYEKYTASNYNNQIVDSSKKYMIIIYGINDFVNKVSKDNIKLFTDFVKKNAQINLVSIVVCDASDAFKTITFEDWFKSGVDQTRGIWIGSGISEQMLIKISKINREDRDEVKGNFGFVVNNSKYDKVKLLESFNPEK